MIAESETKFLNAKFSSRKNIVIESFTKERFLALQMKIKLDLYKE